MGSFGDFVASTFIGTKLNSFNFICPYNDKLTSVKGYAGIE